METNEISTGTQPVPFGVKLSYQIFSVLFWAVAIIFLFSIISLSLRNLFSPASLIYSIAFAGLNGVLAYGFWKMRKWTMTLLGGMTLLVAISIIAVLGNNKNIGHATVIFATFGILFLFTYFSRKFLNGDYKNLKALGLFSAFLIITQIIAFLK